MKKIDFKLTTTTILATILACDASGQTAVPSILPPSPIVQSVTDAWGLDRGLGTIADPKNESVSIGNQYASLSAGNDAGGVFSASAHLTVERLSIYNGGLIVVRVAARGSAHIFSIGTITQTTTYVPPPGSGRTSWRFNKYGTSTTNSTSDTFQDYNDDGAILVCSGPSGQMYVGGTCSIYLASDGSRTDFRMPSVAYNTNVLNAWPSYPTPTDVGYAWPLRTELSDGEILTYNYNNYAEYNPAAGNSPSPTTLNSIESSLGFRIYLSEATPTSLNNPGAMPPSILSRRGKSLYAINTSKEYASPNVATRTGFSTNALSSILTDPIASESILYQNGVLISKVKTLTGPTYGIVVTKPGGGAITYTNLRLQPSLTSNGDGGTVSYPFNAFPALSFSITRRTTKNYSVSVDKINKRPEQYTVTSTNPDGTQEIFVVQYGLLQSITDELGQKTSYSYGNIEGIAFGVSGYSRVSHLTGVSFPGGRRIAFGGPHGAMSTYIVYPSDGGAEQKTLMGIVASCTVSNYRVCNKPTFIKDPKDAQTDFTYDPIHGGLLTETSPANSAGVRAQKRHSYAQISPKALSSSGQLVNGSPVWRLIRTSECISATAANPASCIGTSTELVTVYEYNDSNIFLTAKRVFSGDGALTSLETYTYSYAGDLLTIDGPLAGSDDKRYYTYDNLRRRVFEIGADPDGGGPLRRQVVRHVFDVDGNEIRTEFGVGNAVDGSDFSVTRFTRRTFDPVIGKTVKVEEVVP